MGRKKINIEKGTGLNIHQKRDNKNMLIYTMEIYLAVKKNEIWRKKKLGDLVKSNIKCGEPTQNNKPFMFLPHQQTPAHTVNMIKVDRVRGVKSKLQNIKYLIC